MNLKNINQTKNLVKKIDNLFFYICLFFWPWKCGNRTRNYLLNEEKGLRKGSVNQKNIIKDCLIYLKEENIMERTS